MKLFLLLFVAFLLPLSPVAQHLLHKEQVSVETTVGTNFRTPMVGVFLERETFDNKYPLYFPARVGYYQNLGANPNYLFVQVGFGFVINKKTNIGIYLINMQGQLGKYRNKEPYSLGYDSPFAVFLQLKNPAYPNSTVFLEGSFSSQFLTPAFRFTFKHSIFTIHDK